MSKKLQKSEWNKVADWWDKEVADTGAWHQKHDVDPVILNFLGNVENKKILEVGCGNGYFSRILAHMGANVTAIDLSDKLISLAKEREKLKPSGIRYLVRDAADLKGIKNSYFDIAIASMSLMDIAHAQEAIKEISRVLKKNCHFIFSVNHPVFCDTPWVIIKKGRGKMIAKAVSRYLSSYAEKFILWGSGMKATHYHRSIETYLKYLHNAQFFINDFKEIATIRPVAKAEKGNGDITLIQSKYKTLTEKKMKEFAGKEIPLFLVIRAQKT